MQTRNRVLSRSQVRVVSVSGQITVFTCILANRPVSNIVYWGRQKGTLLMLYYWISPSGGDASMSALADMQTPESLEAFRAGSKRRSFTGVTDARDIFKDNMYSNKRQKLSSTPSIQGEQATPHGNGMLQRGRYGFEHVGALRTKPGIFNHVVHSFVKILTCFDGRPFGFGSYTLYVVQVVILRCSINGNASRLN